jgi:hypothetical protein
MTFETKIVRQTMPTVTMMPNGFAKNVPTEYGDMIALIPPDTSGEWRYREMQILPAFQPASLLGQNPPVAQPSECLVVWERYKEKV